MTIDTQTLLDRIADLERQLEKLNARLDRKLLCAITVPPATRISAGCKIRTVVTALSQEYRSEAVTPADPSTPEQEGK